MVKIPDFQHRGHELDPCSGISRVTWMWPKHLKRKWILKSLVLKYCTSNLSKGPHPQSDFYIFFFFTALFLWTGSVGHVWFSVCFSPTGTQKLNICLLQALTASRSCYLLVGGLKEGIEGWRVLDARLRRWLKHLRFSFSLWYISPILSPPVCLPASGEHWAQELFLYASLHEAMALPCSPQHLLHPCPVPFFPQGTR